LLTLHSGDKETTRCCGFYLLAALALRWCFVPDDRAASVLSAVAVAIVVVAVEVVDATGAIAAPPLLRLCLCFPGGGCRVMGADEGGVDVSTPARGGVLTFEREGRDETTATTFRAADRLVSTSTGEEMLGVMPGLLVVGRRFERTPPPLLADMDSPVEGLTVVAVAAVVVVVVVEGWSIIAGEETEVVVAIRG